MPVAARRDCVEVAAHSQNPALSAAPTEGQPGHRSVAGALLVLERDKLNGPDAKVKAIYRVEMPQDGGVGSAADVPEVLPKTLARNLLPDLQGSNGFVQEKVEGFAVTGNGNLYVVTDNDGLDDANGETQFFDLGPAAEALAG